MIALAAYIEIAEQSREVVVAKMLPEGYALLERLRADQERARQHER
jgi:hypothetical protein